MPTQLPADLPQIRKPVATDWSIARDLGLAIAIAAALSLTWGWSGWADLSRLILPTADDMVRLAQIRDWLGGQRINDLMQYRMAPPDGVPMHWSRIADAGPALLILLAEPGIGRANAELFAILAYPAVLFVAMIVLNARIARRLWGPSAAGVAAVLTGLAYPATTLFAPGRIDHHGLQAICIAAAVLALTRAPTAASGAVVGTAVAVSLAIGLETLPQATALIGVVFLFWTVNGQDERSRLLAAALALGLVTALILLALRPAYWPGQLCDAFTPASVTATLAGAVALLCCAMVSPRLPDWRWRLGCGMIVGSIAIAGALAAYPACMTGPYGAVDPFLRDNMLAHIDEASSLFDEPSLARAIALAGLVAFASVTGLAALARRTADWRAMLPVCVVVLLSMLVMLAQLRGVYVGGPLAPAILAGLVVGARVRASWRSLAVAGSWIACAGVVYLELPAAIERATTGAAPARAATVLHQPDCTTGDVWRRIDAYPAGTMMASINVAAYLLGLTRHATVGASYHRNNAGTLAMYRYFLSPPDRAATIAHNWGVDYVAFCPGDFSELDISFRYPGSVADLLGSRGVSPGLQRLPLRDTRLRLYRVVP